MSDKKTTFLAGIRVVEISDELGEYCGKMLAGLGADVVKVEPPGGEGTRRIGPFFRGRTDVNSSLHFWHYNVGKRSVVLDLDAAAGQESLRALVAAADIVIDTRPKGYLANRGLGYEELAAVNPRLVYARISPFGDSGPWAGFVGSDLVHLALGGVTMNCGYDRNDDQKFDTPPIAPQVWQSYHIAGEMMLMTILGALHHLHRTGEGQLLEGNVHEALSKNTETDLPDWVFLRQPHYRQTCRHSNYQPTPQGIFETADSR